MQDTEAAAIAGSVEGHHRTSSDRTRRGERANIPGGQTRSVEQTRHDQPVTRGGESKVWRSRRIAKRRDDGPRPQVHEVCLIRRKPCGDQQVAIGRDVVSPSPNPHDAVASSSGNCDGEVTLRSTKDLDGPRADGGHPVRSEYQLARIWNRPARELFLSGEVPEMHEPLAVLKC